MAIEASYSTDFTDALAHSTTDTYHGLSPEQMPALAERFTKPYDNEDVFFDQPCYSAYVIRAFARLLRTHEGFPTRELDELEELDVDERIPVVFAHRILQNAVEFTRDCDLGLKTAREIPFGEIGPLDYAISTAATVGKALEIASLYKRLIGDTIDFRLQIVGERATVLLENSVVMPRAALDFQLAMFYRNHFRNWPRMADAGYEVYFTYDKPDSIIEHDLTFPGAEARFSAPFSGYGFFVKELNAPQKTADANLHTVIGKHAALTLAGLPKVQSTTEKVRELLMTELGHGGPYAKRISQQLHISARTLIRKLEHEGTTFKDLVDDVRRRLALRYIGGRDIDFAGVALLLGFSHVTAFHRAFRRWTGQTPLQYRRSRRW